MWPRPVGTGLTALLVVAACLVWPRSTGLAVEVQDSASQPGQDAWEHDEHKVRRRLERLLESGAGEDDPRVRRLRRMLEMMDEDWAGPGRHGRNRHGRRPPCTPQEIEEFVEAHPELRRLFGKLVDGMDGRPGGHRMLLRRFGRQVCEIKRALEQGREEVADLMLESAKTQFEIARRVRALRRTAPDDAERDVLLEELGALVKRQVQIELDIEGLKLVRLRERLERQQQRLEQDRARTDEIAAFRLEKLLSRRGRGWGRGPRDELDVPPLEGQAPAPHGE